MFDMGINTGLRISDLLLLKVGDVRGKTSVTIREKKTGKKRTVFLHMIIPEIATYTEGKEEEAYLFASQRTGQPISTTQAYRIFQKTADLLGRDDIGTHTLRKTFGYQQNKDIGTLMKMTVGVRKLRRSTYLMMKAISLIPKVAQSVLVKSQPPIGMIKRRLHVGGVPGRFMPINICG